jgi:hypothetical protein
LPTDAPAGEFSAGRALQILKDLLPDATPHPTGSDANHDVRDRIVAAFADLGFDPEIQRAFVAGTEGTAAHVENILVRLPGRLGKPAVALACHYDSVRAGPGASDDGMAVAATLEIARILRSGSELRHDVIFLITDGEEQGLLGATAFVRQHAWAKDVAAVVNLEARGTSGASLMFETGRDNGWLVRLFARAVERPISTSAYVSVYENMPNNTDLSVFKAARITGLNFGIIGDVLRYHTPLDDLAHVDPRSLQHHGDNALQCVRALAMAPELAAPPRGNAVFFDVWGWFVVSWPESVAWSLGAMSLLLAFLVLRRLRRAGLLRMRGILLGVLQWPLLLVLGVGLAWLGAEVAASAGALPSSWVARPEALLMAYGYAALFGVGVTRDLFRNHLNAHEAWGMTCFCFAGAALVLALVLPGWSYVFLVPAMVSGAAGLLLPRIQSTATLCVLVVLTSACAMVLLLPLVFGMHDAMGLRAAERITVPEAFAAGTLLPFLVLPRRWLMAVLALGAFGGALGMACLRQPFDADHPHGSSLIHWTNVAEGRAEWLSWFRRGTGPVAGRQRTVKRTFPIYGPVPVMAVPASPLAAEPPVLELLGEVVKDKGRLVRARLRSRRNAPVACLLIAVRQGSSERVSMAGEPLRGSLEQGPEGRLWRRYACATLPAEGIDLEITLMDRKPIDCVVIDETTGLPEGSDELQGLLPPFRVHHYGGDVTMVQDRTKL